MVWVAEHFISVGEVPTEVGEKRRGISGASPDETSGVGAFEGMGLC
jgi:hypothetical protein